MTERSSKKIRVLTVDDSAFMRKAISQMLSNDDQIEVVGIARNGREGVEMATSLDPDVITLDIEMPEMDGLTALRQIMRQCPTHVLMCSSLTTEGSIASLQALKIGAADIIAKDTSQISLSVTNMEDDLRRIVRELGKSPHPRRRSATNTAPPPVEHEIPKFAAGQFDLVVIGSSTGGPPVLEKILNPLQNTMPVPIVVAQHMPEVFTASMADRFNQSSGMPTLHITDGMPIEKGHIYICPGGKHTSVCKAGLGKRIARVSVEPVEEPYRPSANVLFSTAAKATFNRTLAIVLTGIGEDGLKGARELHGLGGVILAQSAETCVVYGMPKAVTQAALITASLTPDEICTTLQTLDLKASANAA